MLPSFNSMILERLVAAPETMRHALMARLVEDYPNDLKLAIGKYRDPSTSKIIRWWLVTESEDILDVDARRQGEYETGVLLSAQITNGSYPCCLNCGNYGIERLFCSVYCEALFLSETLIDA